MRFLQRFRHARHKIKIKTVNPAAAIKMGPVVPVINRVKGLGVGLADWITNGMLDGVSVAERLSVRASVGDGCAMFAFTWTEDNQSSAETNEMGKRKNNLFIWVRNDNQRPDHIVSK